MSRLLFSSNQVPVDYALPFDMTHMFQERNIDSAFLWIRFSDNSTNSPLYSVGVNTGMVYVGAMGPDEHREFAAMGTDVNLASRLQSAADANQILVGEAIAVPDTIQSVIMARMDRLEEEVKYVLQSAAVIGRLFRHKRKRLHERGKEKS